MARKNPDSFENAVAFGGGALLGWSVGTVALIYFLVKATDWPSGRAQLAQQDQRQLTLQPAQPADQSQVVNTTGYWN